MIASTTEKNYNNLLSKHTNSSMISDILYDFGIEQTISGYDLNIPNTRIFGKVFTLRIKQLDDKSDAEGIYDALKTYSYIDDGSIIMVETEVPDYAYFGELNANISIRSGVIGTIVGGHTRDIDCVTNLNFPVFSKGYSPMDVKNHGTLDYYNKEITIEDIVIKPDDYIFADINGIVVIPSHMVDTVKECVMKSIIREMNVKNNILLGLKAEDIPRITGFF